MKIGSVELLRTAISSGRLDAYHVFKFFQNRIQADCCTNSENSFLSNLGLPATNSVVSHVSDLPQADSSGSLSGTPFLVKDNFCMTGPNFTTCASTTLHNFSSPYNASVVQSLLNAGGICLGKTNMDEFAMGSASVENPTHGPVVNPWSPEGDPRIAGGSSGGSAAAVAAGLAPFALASDTGGSVRNPASLCGVVGLKPTYGLASRQGMIPLANIFDCPSIVATRVSDVSEILSVWLQPGSEARRLDATLSKIPKNPLDRNGPPRIGIPKEYYVPGMTEEVALVWDNVASWLADDFKLEVESLSLPHTPIATAVYSVLCAVEVASNMSRYDGLRYGLRAEPSNELRSALAKLDLDTSDGLMAASRQMGFGDEVRNRILAGNFFLLKSQKNRHLDAARRLWRCIKNDYTKVFQKVDLLLAPVNLHPAPSIKDYQKLDSRSRIAREDPCTVGVNLAGLPAITIPIALSKCHRLPIGIQLIGPPWSEKSLIDLAGRIEEKADFPLLVDIPSLLDIK